MAMILHAIQGRLLVIATGAGLLALLFVLVIAMTRDVGQERLGDVDPGIEQVRAFTLPTLDGGRVAITDYADGPVFVCVGMSSCSGIRDSLDSPRAITRRFTSWKGPSVL